MKKNLLALSVAAAFGAGASAALAQGNGLETGNTLVVPYYTVQNGNATLINIVNTDTQRGKALKVRFRGAEHSDDVFDFQVFMSPGDMWTANVSQNGDGLAELFTADTSCTLPANVNQPFVTTRLNGSGAAGTREGYVEIINMGDIITGDATTSEDQSDLYDTIKHSGGVAECDSDILRTIVDANVTNATSVYGTGPGTNTNGPERLSSEASGGLFANVTIINVNEASAWSVPADPVGQGWAVSRYWSQTATPYNGSASQLQRVTLDWIFLGGDVTPAQYDFPDLSTPRNVISSALQVTGSASDPADEYSYVNGNIDEASVFANEYITDDSIFAETDWVLTFPTRRYGVEGRDADKDWNNFTQFDGGAVDNDTTSPEGVIFPFSEVLNSNGCINVDTFTIFDREERTTVADVVISPGEITTLELCGEVAVVSFNNNGETTSAALGAELTLNDAILPYQNGYATIDFGEDLPVIPYAYVKANNGGTGATNMNFGGVWRHRELMEEGE